MYIFKELFTIKPYTSVPLTCLLQVYSVQVHVWSLFSLLFLSFLSICIYKVILYECCTVHMRFIVRCLDWFIFLWEELNWRCMHCTAHCLLRQKEMMLQISVIVMAALWAFINHFSVLLCLVIPLFSCPLCFFTQIMEMNWKARKPRKHHLTLFKLKIHG